MDEMESSVRKVKENNLGAVTVEATIALTAFLFMFIMIYSLINICRAEAKVQVALNNVAKEISQYSYLYGMTGLDEEISKVEKEGEKRKQDANQFAGNAIMVFEEIQNLGDNAASVEINNINDVMDTWGQFSDSKEKIEANLTDIKTKLESMAENPQELMFGLAQLMATEAWEAMKTYAIAEPVCRALIKRNLKRNQNDTADAFCQSVGIVKGSYLGKESSFNGISFAHSEIFPYGSDDIILVATYKVKLLQLLPVKIELDITQMARTKGWLHGDKTKLKSEAKNASSEDGNAGSGEGDGN